METKSNVVRLIRKHSIEDMPAVHEQILVNSFPETYNNSNKISEKTNQGDVFMDWQEKYIDKLDRDIGEMKESLRETEERIANMIDRSLAEMRDRDNQRHQEMLTLISEINAIKNDNLETRRWIIGMVISAIGVSLAAIIGMLSIAF